VLFLMAFTLDSRQIIYSFRAPQPVLWASAINLGLLPLFAWGLMSIQLFPDFAIGLMIAGSVPCTLAAASVWTRKGKGNDAVSLLVTLLTNSLCFVITPFWLALGTRASQIALPTDELTANLFWFVLVPTMAAQLVRLIPFCRELATRRKIFIGAMAQLLILSLVFASACQGGRRLDSLEAGPGLPAVALVWGCCLAIHLAGLIISYAGGKLWGFRIEDRVATAIAGSQKTLPIGIFLATDPTLFGEKFPFAVFPMLMFHCTQLFVDTAIADRFSAWVTQAESTRAADSNTATAAH
ncbi:MAG: bile acid:sodium symporter family protein, partial [Planctomycetaceae bacterium]